MLVAVLHPKCSLISVPQWHHTLHSKLSGSYKVTNMIPVKADLPISSSVIDLSGFLVLEWNLCMSSKN